MSSHDNPGRLFALSQGVKCEGSELCHWCCSPCGRTWPHDDPTPVAYMRKKPWEGGRCPSARFVCEGCRLYRRPSCTVWNLTGGEKPYRDRQSLRKLSWWMTEAGVRGVWPEDHNALWELLLAPPPLFCLSLVADAKIPNHLHLAHVNSHDVVKAETTLYFTVDNVKHSYDVYELKQTCKHGAEGKSPGCSALVRVLGPHPLPDEKYVEGRRGRPPKHEDDDLRRVVSKR